MSKSSFHVPSVFFRFIIGQQGQTVKRIQNETDTMIKIPRYKDENIEITGKNEDDVHKARKQIESIVLSSRNKIRVNHFTNIRITKDEIRRNYERFREEILLDLNVDGLTEKMFMPTIKLHITANVMTLLHVEECARATQLLNDCVEQIIRPLKNQFGKITLGVCGINIFRGNKKFVDVLFGQIQSDSLQQLLNGIMEYFIEKGVSRRERGRTNVKMHMTLINTRYDKSSTCETFDATSILEKYANYNFGEQEVNEILLSSMEAKDSDGFYKTIASVKF